MINSKTKIAGIFGYPVGHSLSPAMQNAAITRMGLNFVYLPFTVEPKHLKRAVDSIKVLGIKGVNVTVPHKEKVIQYLDDVSEEAKKIGAVNTIVNSNGVLTGHNTDCCGFTKSLKEHINPCGRSVFMLGCGGAAKAIFYAVLNAGIKEITVADIDERKANKLLKSGRGHCKINIAGFRDVGNIFESADIFINATPVGMNEKDGSPVEKKYLRKNLFIYDVVYNRPTLLSKYAAATGAKYLNGLDMLVYQGAASFELWFGKKPSLPIMKKTVMEALK